MVRRSSDGPQGKLTEARSPYKRATSLVSPRVLMLSSQLLRKNEYRRRKALKKKTMGPRNPYRNAQSEETQTMRVAVIEVHRETGIAFLGAFSPPSTGSDPVNGSPGAWIQSERE
jgi:hypothetical protein